MASQSALGRQGTWTGAGTYSAKPISQMTDQEYNEFKALDDRNWTRMTGLDTNWNAPKSMAATPAIPVLAPKTDANNSNPNFSWNNEDMQKGMWQQAKDMSQLQLDNTLKTMGAAAGYRGTELAQTYNQDRTLANDNYGFQINKTNLDGDIARRQANDQFGFNRTLANDNYSFQQGMQRSDQDFQVRKAGVDDEIFRRQADQRFGFERTLANDNYAFRNNDRAERERANDEELERTYQMRTETTNSAREAAAGAFFGGGNRFNARR